MIDLLPNIEQQQIADSINRFLADNLPVDRYRRIANKKPKLDRDLWEDLAALGSFGLSLSEEQGGAGLSIVEEIMAFREYGRFLVTPTVLGTVLAAQVAAAAGRDDLAGELVAGGRAAALLNPLRPVTLSASTSGEFQAIDAREGDLLIAWNDKGAALFEAASVKQAGECIDPTVTLGRVSLSGAKPLALVAADKAPIGQTALILLAAQLTGMIEAVRDMAVEYAKTRQQFGHPIGVFQAVKHRCSDMALWAEAAWSQTAWAALMTQSGAKDAAFQATNAEMIAADAALDAARRTVQIHGAMGFTAEVNVHLYLKRAHLFEQLGGGVQRLQEKLLELPLDV
jgi:alkylation response protein AidB-like acyl-CoA dehydrogenase